MAARLLLACLVLLLAVPGHAADARQAAAATAMGHQAAESFTAGDFAKAARQYLNAFHLDPSQSALLYGAARAEHMSDQLDLALQHYDEFLKADENDAARAENARKYISEIKMLQGNAKAQEAEKALRAGNSALAATLYLEAARLAPTHLDWLLKSATQAEQAGQLDVARQRYNDVRSRAAKGAPEREEAQARLAVLDPAAAQRDPVAGTVQVRSETKSNALGWTLTAAGAAVALAGLGLGLSTLSDANAWHRDAAIRQNGQIAGTDYQTASSTVASLNLRTGLAIGLGAGGLACAGVGTWLLLRAPDAQVTVAPGPVPLGASWAVRF